MSRATSAENPSVNLDELLDLFYGPPIDHSQLAEFHSVPRVPAPYDQLLNHQHHMTITVESQWHESVDVHVHRVIQDEHIYAREVTLVSSVSRKIVQYGIVRLQIAALDADIWKQVESQQVPLGRALIDGNVLREVQLCGLWRVRVGPSLASLMHLCIGDQTYGRTAIIHCDGAPAIELLEIVTPVD
jgi:chorismate-pyruvate lyase